MILISSPPTVKMVSDTPEVVYKVHGRRKNRARNVFTAVTHDIHTFFLKSLKCDSSETPCLPHCTPSAPAGPSIAVGHRRTGPGPLDTEPGTPGSRNTLHRQPYTTVTTIHSQRALRELASAATGATRRSGRGAGGSAQGPTASVDQQGAAGGSLAHV